MPGGAAANWWEKNKQPTPIAPTSQFGAPESFTAAANQQAGDYDKIMKMYENIAQTASTNPITASSISGGRASGGGEIAPSLSSYSNVGTKLGDYSQSADEGNALRSLSDLSETGGYTEQGKQDLRARGIAPTRSIYANAQENVKRARALGGGYSPNANAVQRTMARDESSAISDINTNVNAGIAQNVASNRIQAAPAYASASARANEAKTESDRHNADIINQINSLNAQNQQRTNEFNAAGTQRANEFNAAGRERTSALNANNALDVAKFNASTKLAAGQANQGTQLQAAGGMANLYGTTPALTNTFGNQVTQAASIGQNQQGLDQQKQRDKLNFATRVGGIS